MTTQEKQREIGRKAWIQGNVILFKKPTYKSAFFDMEEVLVIPIKKTKNKGLDRVIDTLLTT